jgi:hypothetical protein
MSASPILLLRNDENMRVERTESVTTTFSLLGAMRVERGTLDDWEALHELHYKSEGRVIGRVWRCMLEDRLVAVAIISSPRLLLAGRHEVFPKLKPGADSKLTNTYRAKFVNQHFGLASRIVVDTLFRAAGVSYRMLNLVARMEGKRYMEIQSSMSRFNPFAIRAGFQFASLRSAAAHDRGLQLMTRLFEAHPADHQGLLTELSGMGEREREKVLKTLREFYFRHSALEKTGTNLNGDNEARVAGYSPEFLLKNLIQLVFAAPMYGVYPNPDAGRELPPSLPLSAFDLQPVTERLVLS